MRRAVAAAVLALLLVPDRAFAGAWTLGEGHWQSFTAVTQSSADLGFGAEGRANVPTTFSKTLFRTPSNTA